MSLVIATYVPEGIVMASDSRQVITVERKSNNGKGLKVETVNSDAVMKTFLLQEQSVGISTFGADLLAGVPMSSHVNISGGHFRMLMWASMFAATRRGARLVCPTSTIAT